MSEPNRLVSSLPKNTLPRDPSKILTALWGLRLVLNHEYGTSYLLDSQSIEWLELFGDCVEWPLDLLNEFSKVDSEMVGGSTAISRCRKKQITRINWREVSWCFVNAYSKQPERLNLHFQKSITQLEQHWLSIRDQNTVWKNITLLGDQLHLSELERTVIHFCLVVRGSMPNAFQQIESDTLHDASKILAFMLGSTTENIMQTVHYKEVLVSSGFIYVDRYDTEWPGFIGVPRYIKAAFQHPNKDIKALMQHFTDEATLGHLKVKDMPHLQDSLQLLTRVMGNALLKKERGVNILLYGAPGTGKTQFAKLLAQQVGAVLYEVDCQDSRGESISDRDRYGSFLLAQKILSARDDTFLLFDEVEDVFETAGSFDFHERHRHQSHFSKAWVNQQLEENPVPVVWICNDYRSIDPAHLRRFLFHLEFRVPPRSVRHQMVAGYFKEFNLSNSVIKKLSLNPSLSPAQLKNTARLLTLNGCQDQLEAESLVETAIQCSMAVMGQTVGKNPSKSVTPYRLDYLNVDCQVPMAQLLKALKTRSKSSLCFYGPPGTGKTQLAEYFAEQLDQTLIVKRASDILSKWLGESEQNIATMFEQARDEKAILFLDEADSFLRNRQDMSRSWEVSQVNELLQQMERFDSLFICATNLFEQIDQAALRRFAFKIRFDYLKPSQRIALFAESLQLATSPVGDSHQRRLQKLDWLTPGDFSTVLRQAHTFGERPSAHEFLNQLENECATKNGGRNQRSIGFIN